MSKKIFLIFLLLFQTSLALAKTYDLEIKKQDVFITKKAVEAITINDSIPGPILYWQEGEVENFIAKIEVLTLSYFAISRQFSAQFLQISAHLSISSPPISSQDLAQVSHISAHARHTA